MFRQRDPFIELLCAGIAWRLPLANPFGTKSNIAKAEWDLEIGWGDAGFKSASRGTPFGGSDWLLERQIPFQCRSP